MWGTSHQEMQNATREESLEQTVENALRQIEEKNYDADLLAKEY